MRYDDFTIQSESYRKGFWNKMMKGQTAPYETMNKGTISSDTYVLPYDSKDILNPSETIKLFRPVQRYLSGADAEHHATCMPTYLLLQYGKIGNES